MSDSDDATEPASGADEPPESAAGEQLGERCPDVRSPDEQPPDSSDAERNDADEQAERFTEGTLVWPLLTLAGPLVATQILQTLYNLADAFWVGQVSADAITAVSFAWPIVFLLISVGGGMTAAGTILVSQYTGARDDEAVGHVAGQTLGFVALLSLAISIVGIVAAPWLISLLGADPDGPVHAMATDYTRITFLGLWAMFGFFVFQALLRGWGDTKTPMYLMVGSVGLNLVLDPFFVLGFADNPLFGWLGLQGLQATLHGATGFDGYGVAGAAFATVLSRGLAALVGAWLLFGGHVGLRLAIEDLLPSRATIEQIVRIGTPGAIDQSTQSIAAIVMTALVATVGQDAVAAYGIGTRFVSLVWLPMAAMGMSVETVVGQNLGGGHTDRARRTVYVAIAILVAAFLVVGALTVWYARPIVGLFVSGPEAGPIVDHGATFLRIVAPTWVVMAAYHMMNGAFYGAGSTRLAMSIGVTTLWGVRIVVAVALILVLSVGAVGAWYAIALSNVTAAVAGAVFFFRGHWLRDVLEADATDEPDRDTNGGSPD